MRKRDNPFKEIREEQIKKAALKVFSEKGYHKATMSEIAEAADIGKGTIYWYWKSKQDLAYSLFFDMQNTNYNMVLKALSSKGPVINKFMNLSDDIVEYTQNNKQSVDLLLKFWVDRDNVFTIEHMNKIDEMYYRAITGIKNLLDEGMANGELNKDDSMFLSIMIQSMASGIDRIWLELGDEFPLRKAYHKLVEFVMTTLRSGA